MDVVERVIEVLRDALGLDPSATPLSESTLLFESLPEMDSLGVVSVVHALEERFGILVEGEEIDAETFATVGTLARFVESKIADPAAR